jgi:hypothetical protein
MQRRLLVERPEDPYVREEVTALGESPGASVAVGGDTDVIGPEEVEALARLARLAGAGWVEPRSAEHAVDVGATMDDTVRGGSVQDGGVHDGGGQDDTARGGGGLEGDGTDRSAYDDTPSRRGRHVRRRGAHARTETDVDDGVRGSGRE